MRQTKNGKELTLSVFFPAHNEAENIGQVVSRAVGALEALCEGRYEIIIVDDGSTDGTGKVADELAKQYPTVRVIHHPKNLGYGGAVWTGIKESRNDIIFFTDGDGQFDITEIDQFWEEIPHYDAIFGYRIKRSDGLHRLLFAWAWGKLIRFLFGIKVRDLDCAFKMFWRDLFTDLTPETFGAMVTVEILAKLVKKGIKYKEIGVHHYPRRKGKQSGGSIKVIVRAFKELFKVYPRLKRYKPS